MPKKIKDLFTLIFCDAQVIDLDFSEWDKQIRLCVVGLDVEYPVPDRLPLFMVDFKRVSFFSCTFFHLGTRLKNERHHFQWNIHDFQKKTVSNGLQIELIGSGASPKIEIICERYDIKRLSHSILDNVFPHWDRPFGPFARPSIEVMIRKFKSRQT
jgi:hypothetical protein